MKIFKANKNKDLNIECYSFKNNESDFDKLCKICEKCKYFDQGTDFPNCFCEKSNEMIDFHFCSPVCPLNKWKIEELKKVVNEIVQSHLHELV